MSSQSKSNDADHACPHCGTPSAETNWIGLTYEYLTMKWKYKCRNCGSDFTVTVEPATIDDSLNK